MSETKNPESFETTLERLETLVKTMEAGGGTLEETLRLYEEGVALSKGLQKQLEKAQGRLAELSEKGGEMQEQTVAFSGSGAAPEDNA